MNYISNQPSRCISALAVAIFALAGCASNPDKPASGQLHPVTERITDRAIFQDMTTYDEQQGRIKAVNDAGRARVGSYALSKAQCWLDVSLHEYSRNDRGGFPQAALAESNKITQELQANGQSPSAQQTLLVNNAARLRQDLWDAAAKLKTHPGWRCAEQKAACAEVELVHAGNEFNQQEWRHAKPYIQIAEDLIGDAQKAAEACLPPPTPVAAAPAPAPVVAPVAPVPVNLSANALFNFDKRDLANVRAYTRQQVDALIAQIKSGVTVSSIRLVGHADRLNSTGDANYNTKLSQDRVQTIRDYLVSQGIDGKLITTEFRSDTQQIEACTRDKFRSNAELQECLLPNRRVEIVVSGTRRAQ